MKKIFKIILWTILSVIAILIVLLGGFMYKVKNGFPVVYETEIPYINFPENRQAILLFSKSSGFRHAGSIDTSKIVFAELARRNNWFLYDTEDGGVFSPQLLAKFKVVVFNNSTGEVINEEQKKSVEDYVKNGGRLMGIHGAGDDSHHWDWYEQNLMGAKFSHHPLKEHLQEAEVVLEAVPDTILTDQLPLRWRLTEEWYVFFENPRAKGFNIIYTIDGDKINPNGNMLWMSDKNFGMGKDHPVAWYKTLEKGSTFYTSMGHDQSTWRHKEFVRLIENALR